MFLPPFRGGSSAIQFNVQMLYLPALKNVVADFWSRLPPSPEPPGTVANMVAADPVDLEAMAAEQNRCVETQHLLSSSSLKIVFRHAGDQRLVNDISTGDFCPIVPEKFRSHFLHLHNISYPVRLTS
jgi:hypothetical protein